MIGNVKERERQTVERGEIEGDSTRLSRIEPSKVRVVALVVKHSGQIKRYDCYDPNEEAGIENVISLKKGEIWLRSLDWAQSKSASEVHYQWRSTGLTPEEVGRVSIFRWPKGTSVRVFVDAN